MGTVHDLDARRARPRAAAPAPAGPGDVVPLVRRPTVEVTAAPQGAPPDGRVYVTVSPGGGERCAVPLDLDGAARLARGLREVAEGVARAAGRLVLLRPTAPGGLRLAAAPERGMVVARRDGAVLLDLARSGRRAWFSTLTGEPIGRYDGGLRLSARDAARLRRAT